MAKSKSIGCGGLVLILLGVGIVGSWFNSDDGDTTQTATIAPSATTSRASVTFNSYGCLPVSTTLVDSIAQGFDGSTLTGRAAGYKASQYEDVKFIAVEFTPNGLTKPEVAVIGTNDDDLADIELNGLIIAVDGFAKEFSDWGDAPGIGLSITDDGAKEAKECLELPGYKLADPPPTPASFDEAEFLRIAADRYGVFDETFDDGSTLTVMNLAYTICNGDLVTMRKNLGSDWDTSFNKFVLESLCPEKLE